MGTFFILIGVLYFLLIMIGNSKPNSVQHRGGNHAKRRDKRKTTRSGQREDKHDDDEEKSWSEKWDEWDDHDQYWDDD